MQLDSGKIDNGKAGGFSAPLFLSNQPVLEVEMTAFNLPQYSAKNVLAFWAKINQVSGLGPNGDCWEWTGATVGRGYGRMWFAGKPRRATHVSWLLRHGRLPTAFMLHSCDNPPCVNPDHLYDGTSQDNANDASIRGRLLFGEKHTQAKLTEKEVLEVMQWVRDGFSYSQVGRRFGVTGSTVGSIVRGKTWRHLQARKGE